METTLTVPSISCSICASRIKKELGGMEGIEGINIDLKEQALKVVYNPALLRPQDIKDKIADMGYEIMQ